MADRQRPLTRVIRAPILRVALPGHARSQVPSLEEPLKELKTYPEGTPFTGTIGRTAGESEAAWPQPRRARAGAPNVLVFLLDDVGFAQLGCFGSDIRTPNFDRLAAGGLRYRDFHTTAICSPTRACLLTGRNHHSNGVGIIQEMATGFPGLQRHGAP